MIVRRPWARLLPLALAPAIVVTGLSLPVIDLGSGSDLAERPAVGGTEQVVALSGIDPQAVASSSVAMASWGEPR